MSRQIRRKAHRKAKSVKDWKKNFAKKKSKAKPYILKRMSYAEAKARSKARMKHKVLGHTYTNAKGGRTKVMARVHSQTGRESAFGRKVDAKITALPPGKRYSYATGGTYWETRINRSDKSRTRKL